MVVYVLTNRMTGKVYVGQTVQVLADRLRLHRHSSSCRHLYRAIKKYGFSSFSVDVIKKCKTLDEMNEAEVAAIQEFKSTDSFYGYNLRSGGRNSRMAEESKLRLSRSAMGNKRCLGREVKIESRRKLFKAVVCSNGKTYESLLAASADLKVQRQNITHVLHGRLPHAGGFTFRFLEQER